MPQIIVVADTQGESGAAQVMFRERVTRRDFESGHFGTQLVERLGWAVGDAHAVDHVHQAKRIESAAAAAKPSAVEPSDDPAASDECVSAETPQRRSARVVTTAS
jgi:hypothetical protein